VSVFDSGTDELIEMFKVQGIDRSQVSAIWELPAGVAAADEFPITAHELDRINRVLDRPLRLDAGRELFLGLHRDYPGEVIEDAGGERWYPAPGLDVPLLLPGIESLRSVRPKPSDEGES